MRRLFYAGRVTGWVIRFLFRLLAGRNLFGPRRTDATFLEPATRQLDPNAPALHRWEMQRGLTRLLWRLAGGYLLLLLGALLILSLAERIVRLPWALRPGTLILIHCSVILILCSAQLLRIRIRDYGMTLRVLRKDEEEGWRWEQVVIPGRREWLEEKILPVSRSSAIILGTSIPDRKADQWVTVPKDYREPGGSPVEIRLPATFTGADQSVKTRLERSVAAKLGMKELTATWRTEGSNPSVLLSSPPEPPRIVSFADVEHFLRAQAEWDFLYGIAGSGESFSISVTGDTPHGAVSSGSGGGKSELLKGIIAQAGHKGWFSVILDWKEESQEWAKGLPGVRYLTTVEGIHDMCIAVGEEIEYRKAHPDTPRPRLLLVCEEWSITAPLLTEFWATLRGTADPEERKTMPPRSPAITSVMKVIFAGRALGVFLQFVAIRFSARVTNGNADLRESFQVINMARYKPQTVKMLAPDVKPFPKKSKHPGRWVAVSGDEAVVYQGVLWSDEAAREWHQSGIEIPASPWAPRFGTSFAQQASTTSTLGDVLRLDAAGRSQDLPVLDGEVLAPVDARKLSEMVSALEPLGVTWNVLRNASRDGEKGDPDFPPAFGGSPNKGYTYDFEQVKEWARRRYASQRVEK